MAQRRKKYSKEFKERAVELLENTELAASEIAADLDIHQRYFFEGSCTGGYPPTESLGTLENKFRMTLLRHPFLICEFAAQ